MSGWIYVLDDGQGHYKIGRTNSLDGRMKRLKIQLPFAVTIAYACEVDDPVAAEKYLHQLFADRRMNGEWFALGKPDFGPIAEIASGRHVYEENGHLYEFPDVNIYDYEIEEIVALEQEKAEARIHKPTRRHNWVNRTIKRQ